MSEKHPYIVEHVRGGVPVKRWTRGVPVETAAINQLKKTASLPFIHRHVAAMPDVHVGIGATVGSVIPTRGAIIPAAVGVDIGCGMMAVKTELRASQLPDDLSFIRSAIERCTPHGRTAGRSRRGGRDKGAWGEVPDRVAARWKEIDDRFWKIVDKYPEVERSNHAVHLGTLGTGNHFIELCLDEGVNDEGDKVDPHVWVMLHSGSRGVGNRIGSLFIKLAKDDMKVHVANLPDKDLAYLSEGTERFDDYVEAVGWAQDFARINRELMMEQTLFALRTSGLPWFEADLMAVNCHHNYVAEEEHFGERCLVTRKGAVRAGRGELGIIPGSMGAKSFIVRGKGNAESFCSCSHGAGRKMSRTEAKKRFTVDDHVEATRGVECRKDKDVIDETPAAYKDIDAVMAAQADLVEIVHTLKQVVCVKG